MSLNRARLDTRLYCERCQRPVDELVRVKFAHIDEEWCKECAGRVEILARGDLAEVQK